MYHITEVGAYLIAIALVLLAINTYAIWILWQVTKQNRDCIVRVHRNTKAGQALTSTKLQMLEQIIDEMVSDPQRSTDAIVDTQYADREKYQGADVPYTIYDEVQPVQNDAIDDLYGSDNVIDARYRFSPPPPPPR